MPTLDGHTLLTLLVMTCGSGAFLRLVAREKHRRDKYLELRLMDRMKELEEEERRKREEAEERHKREARWIATPDEENDGEAAQSSEPQ